MQQLTLWHNHTGSRLEYSVLPATKPGQLMVQAHYSLISTGSERLVISQPLSPATAASMRIPYMQGEFSSTFTYGYSLTGIVIDGPGEWMGKAVHLLHPHQRYALVDSSDACPLPTHLSLKKATLISNLETAVNAVWDAQLSMGDRVIVIGYGIIGTLLCELIFRYPGIELYLIETDSQRASAARINGLTVFGNTADLPTAVDIAFNCSADNCALQAAIDAVGFEGTVVELSWYGERSSEVKLGGSFHYHRKRIVSSQVSNIPGHKRQRWNHTDRKALVLRLLDSLDTDAIIGRTVPFSNADKFYNSLRLKPPTERGIIIDYLED